MTTREFWETFGEFHEKRTFFLKNEPIDSPADFLYAEVIDDYWMLEIKLSDAQGLAYSYIDDCLEEYRTCYICGTIQGTNEFGEIPDECINKRCKQIRNYWKIKKLCPYFITMHHGGQSARFYWLKKRIKTLFNGSQIRDIKKEIIFEFLLTAMLVRIAA